MSKLNKEEVLELFSAAYLAANGKQPEIEQKSGWYKVDGGKSVRLTDLVDMTTELKSGATAAPSTTPAASPKKAAKKPAKKAASSNGGLTAKALWAQKNANGNRLPRGF